MTTASPEALFLSFATEIDDFCRGVFRYKTSCAFPRFPTLDISRSPVRLYLRFRPGGFWPDDSVVIARIEFRDRRSGHGTALLRKLVELSGRYQLKSIGIEQTGSDDSINNFIQKFGFRRHGADRNWLVEIDKLEPLLATMPTVRPERRRAAGGRVKSKAN